MVNDRGGEGVRDGRGDTYEWVGVGLCVGGNEGYDRLVEGGCEEICEGVGDCGWGITGCCLRYGSRLFGVDVPAWF